MFLPLYDDVEKNQLPTVTLGLMAINIVVFAAMFGNQLSGEFYTYEESEHNMVINEFYETWGLVPADLAQGQVIGLLTKMFFLERSGRLRLATSET